MNITALFQGINWKTTLCAIAYLLCGIVSTIYPAFTESCGMLENIFLALGLVSAADSTRLQSIVQAVDHISWKNGVDPATLQPVTPPAAPKA